MSRSSFTGLYLFALLASSSVVQAALFTNPSQLPTNKKYDYVVVGSGPGGSTVASRLSENSNVNVLLIESGGRYAVAFVSHAQSSF